MFIIWGSRHTSKIVGTVKKDFHCSHCNNITPYQITKEVDWFTLYWIPIIPMTTVYRAECPICNYGFEIEKERAKEILEQLKTEDEHENKN